MRTILITKTIGRQHQSRTPDTSHKSLIAQIQAYPTISHPHLTPVFNSCFIPFQTAIIQYIPSIGPESSHYHKGVRL
jgi:hypothetical protein